jgi:hypothetical protein
MPLRLKNSVSHSQNLRGVLLMFLSDLKKIDAECRRRFTYVVTDFELYHWRSHGDEVLQGKSWEDCCSGLTSTVLDLVTRTGEPLENCCRLLVGLNTKRSPDHMVGAVLTEQGWWVVGDTTPLPPYKASSMRHHTFFYNLLSEAGLDPVWRTGVPWLSTTQ